MEHLTGLNDKQKEAVMHIEGPLLIVAGAGAGKTKTITHRVAQLIHSGIPAEAILAVTFTNKAAGEMRERILKLLGTVRVANLPLSAEADRRIPFISTFHALGVRLLREFSKEAGLTRSFSIWDRDDSVRAVKNALKELGYENQYNPRMILGAISRQKGDGVTADEYAARAKYPFERAAAQAWNAYEAALRREHALDFDDLLVRTLQLLIENEKIRLLLQRRWTHITIDEYQDTNRVQYEIVRLLSGEKKNICVVGDIDQNIYSWRGADISHLLSFETMYPNATVVTLEQNYRSTQNILEAANAVIEKNVRRQKKHLFSANPKGELIEIYKGGSEMDEGQFVVSRAAELIRTGTKPSEIAVLYRENFQSRALEEAFLTSGVQYRVLGIRFFERKEVRDTLSYLRFALNRESHGDLARIIGVPVRGIGAATLARMLEKKEHELSALARAKVAMFLGVIEKIKTAIGTRKASEAVLSAIVESGMEEMYRKGHEEGHERLLNMRELAAYASRYDSLPTPEGIERLLEDAALQSEQDGLQKPMEAVSLMTVHASKGLEFDAVFVTGLEQGLFPEERVGDEERDPEEERRLFYVALTRAKHRLFLSSASTRMKYGNRDYTLPSEFLDDIDPLLCVESQREKPARIKRTGGILDDYDDIIT